MKIKDFKKFLKENFEDLNNNIEDSSNTENIDNVTDDSENIEQEEDNSEESDITPQPVIQTPIINKTDNCCNILIINGCEADSPVYKKTEEFKKKCGTSCKEIHLYQLNIQNTKKNEVKDGMVQVYEAIDNADAIIFACNSNKGKLSDILETAISRIKNYYKKGELKNKIFGSIVIGNEEKVKNDLILTALNDLGMVVCADCLCFCNDKSTSNIAKMVDSITSLINATSSMRTVYDDNATDFKSFDDFEKEDQKEEITDVPHETSDIEEVSDFSDLESIDEPVEDSIEDQESIDQEENVSDSELEEEEEKLIDNGDGTITQIHKGEKIKESITLTYLPFDSFIK